MEPLVLDSSLFEVKSWSYLQEGNENIVFSYVGPSSNYRTYVLRLPKALAGAYKKKSLGDHKSSFQQSFFERVISPLVNREYLQDKIIIPADKKFLSLLNEAALKVRPAERLHKYIDVNLETMTLTKNLLCLVDSGPNFSVEIKPKWGFFPSSRYLKSDSVKRNKCRFCMHQILKASEDGKPKSRYCPILLYSSDPTKKYRAIQQLFETPQNNLRCFIDGKETEPGLASDTLSKLLSSCDNEIMHKMLTSILTKDKVLDKLKQFQEDFDLYDTEGIAQILQTLGSLDLEEATEIQWSELIENYLQGFRLDTSKDLAIMSMDEKLMAIHAFLISATFKDCSIIITFSPAKSSKHAKEFELVSEFITSDSVGLKWIYQLGIVDLDPKPIKKLNSYIKLDQKITEAFLAQSSGLFY